VKKNIFMLGNRGMQTPMRRFCTKWPDQFVRPVWPPWWPVW
jgi:hypothetical protein